MDDGQKNPPRMSTQHPYKPMLLASLLLLALLLVLYPYYQYYIDPDGTAYLTIARRYATGDYTTAINGYWSPWACWLTALLMKTGIAAIPASVAVNATGAVGYLFISQSFFLKYGLDRRQQWLLAGALCIFLCFAIFWQSFDDLWECFFLLAALRVLVARDFATRPFLWVAYGTLGALGYFAKAYALPFFILHTLVCGRMVLVGHQRRWLPMAAVAIGTLLAVALPWLLLLYHKYGFFTTSTSGSLNMSWYLVGHPVWKDGIRELLPVPYPDSPYYWEDPWLVNGATPHFWDSWQLAGSQMLRLGWNLLKFCIATAQHSVFALVVYAVAVWAVYKQRLRQLFPDGMLVLAASFLLFPSGYWLVNFEGRYLWYMLPLGMVLGSKLLHKQNGMKWLSRVPYPVFVLSYIVFPIWGLWQMHGIGSAEYKLAQLLKKEHIKGAFIANRPAASMCRLAYFSGNAFYSNFRSWQDKEQEIQQDRARYGVPYYYHFTADSLEVIRPLADSMVLVEAFKL